MNRRRAIGSLAALGGSALWPFARAQQQAGMRRVAILTYGSPANFRTRAEAFTEAMRALGYEQGKNVTYVWRSANGQEDTLRRLAEEIAREPFDVVLSPSITTSRALHKATKTMPVVMGAVEDPVGEGFVRSLARPGTNMTGISASVLDHLQKQMELLVEVAPAITQVTALLNPGNTAYRTYRERLEAAAARRKLKLIMVAARSPDQIEDAFAPQARNEASGVLVMNDPVYYNERAFITEVIASARRPAIYPHRGYVEAGGLMSYGANPDANFARAAIYVDRILKGAKPAELAIEAPARFEVVIHRGASQSLGLTVPTDLLTQATVIIS